MQVAGQLPPQPNITGNNEVFVERTIVQGNEPLPVQGMTLVSQEVGQPVIVTHAALPGQLTGYAPQQGALNNNNNAGIIGTGLTHPHQGTVLATAPLVGASPVINNGHLAGPGPVVGQNIGTGTAGTNYSGTYSFRLQEGRFFKDHDWLTKMDPYVKIKIGPHIGRSVVAKKQGTTPVWNDVIRLERKHLGNFAKIKVKDRDRLSLNDRVGETRIPLSEIAVKGRVSGWFPVYKKEEKTGEVLMEIIFEPII